VVSKWWWGKFEVGLMAGLRSAKTCESSVEQTNFKNRGFGFYVQIFSVLGPSVINSEIKLLFL
jgi:hypothetical protein